MARGARIKIFTSHPAGKLSFFVPRWLFSNYHTNPFPFFFFFFKELAARSLPPLSSPLIYLFFSFYSFQSASHRLLSTAFIIFQRQGKFMRLPCHVTPIRCHSTNFQWQKFSTDQLLSFFFFSCNCRYKVFEPF